MMVHLDGVGFGYGGPLVLHDVNAAIESGEVVGIIGPSGAGKTTLLRILLGELVPTQGSIHVAPGSALAVGYVPQMDAGERTFPITVEETVLLGGAALSSRRPWFDRAERRRAHGILERLGIAAFAAARLDELSGGQFQRVLIGRALMSQPNLLVLDEPTSGIDLKTRSQVLQLVDELRADGYTVILTTHDLNWVAAHLPRIICLNRTVVADGSPLQVLTGAVVRQTYGAAMDVLVHNGRPVVVDAVEGSAP
jgi:ABC-type Mn2+/Zn2+ transport system ATPase subunit